MVGGYTLFSVYLMCSISAIYLFCAALGPEWPDAIRRHGTIGAVIHNTYKSVLLPIASAWRGTGHTFLPLFDCRAITPRGYLSSRLGDFAITSMAELGGIVPQQLSNALTGTCP